jgi:hypothetical protein
MKHAIWNRSGVFAAAAGLALLLVAAPASAQAPDAADRCTPDVMRLCSEFVPDADRIVQCLKVKRRQLSPSCSSALQPQGSKSAGSKSSSSKSSSSKSSSSKSSSKKKSKS